MLKLAIVVLGALGVIFFTPLGAPIRDRLATKVSPARQELTILAGLHKNLAAAAALAGSPAFSSAPQSARDELAADLSAAAADESQANALAETSDFSSAFGSLIHQVAPSAANSCK